MANKVLVLGKGYLGKEFERHGFETWGKSKLTFQYPLPAFPNNALEEIRNYDVVVNCIGKSNTRWCEREDNLHEAMFVNSELPGLISEYCNRNGIRYVHISTGCLYGDTVEPATESTHIAAHCRYTLTKWMGEILCNPKDLIVRPRLYFSDVEDKNNLLCKLQKFRSFTGDKVDSVSSTSTIVGAVKELIQADQSGIFNVAQEGSASIAKIALWCGLPVKEIITAKQLQERKIYILSTT